MGREFRVKGQKFKNMMKPDQKAEIHIIPWSSALFGHRLEICPESLNSQRRKGNVISSRVDVFH